MSIINLRKHIKKPVIGLLILGFVTLINPVRAEQQVARSTFELAEKYLAQGNIPRFEELYKQLHFYPLQPYLEQKKLLNHISMANAPAIEEFLKRYEDTPLDWPLRKKWLEYLDKNKQTQLYLKYFEPTSDAAMTCRFHLYQLKAGLSKNIVLPKVTELWQVGKSQPSSCDPLFDIWQKAGYRTKDVIWQRIINAADGGKHTLLPYLINLLPKSEQTTATLWQKVRIDPAYIRTLSRFPQKSLMETQILTYGLQRYIWRDPEQAIKVFKEAEKKYPFSVYQIKEITQTFALALASKGHDDAAAWFAKLSENQYTSKLTQWRITEIVRTQDWPAIKKALLAFPAEQQQALQWRYWYGRTLLALNEETAALKILSELAKERHYYGFLAAGYTESPINLQHAPIFVSEEDQYRVLSAPAAKRAFEFFHLGRFLEARSEWNYWMKKLPKKDKLIAAKIANGKGWFDRAIFTLSAVDYLDDVDLRFPLAYQEEINNYAQKNKINPAWAFAIARRESSFMSDAHSPVGASGLMQLMPATAKLLAKKAVSRAKLYEAEFNISLGTAYLKQLSDRYQGNQILATASYNAGPHRVKQWLADRSGLPADIWIETIPYQETRDYVKSVMAYQQIYQLSLGQKPTIFTELANSIIGNEYTYNLKKNSIN